MPVTTQSLNRVVLFLVILLLLFGEIILFSATGVLGAQRHGTEFYFIMRQSIVAILGLFAIVILSKIKAELWCRFSEVLMLLQIFAVVATYLPGIGHSAQGAARWLSFAAFTFQPSELSKITVSLYLASNLSKHHDRKYSLKQWWIRMVPILILFALILRQPDLGTTILLLMLTLLLFFVAGARPTWIAGGFLLSTLIFGSAVMLSDYRRRRLLAFLNPWSDPLGSGFQTIQSFVSFHSGGLLGIGLGNGNSKLFYLPDVHTDFLFALIGEELGFLGAFGIIIAYSYLYYLLYRIAHRAHTLQMSYLAFALTTALALQTTINLMGVTGLLPTKGLPLPFLSWGRSALMAHCLTIGILLNISSRSEIIPLNQTTLPDEFQKDRHYGRWYGWPRLSRASHSR